MRRLNRDEYEQNLRDVLQLPDLDIRDILPEDREGHRFNKTTEMLDMSRVQLSRVSGRRGGGPAHRDGHGTGAAAGDEVSRRRHGFVSRHGHFRQSRVDVLRARQQVHRLGPEEGPGRQVKEAAPPMRASRWRSFVRRAGLTWALPKAFVAKHAGRYKVRFSARAVLQQPGVCA